MEPTYSLAYFDHLFEGVRGPAYWELVSASADELDDYAQAVDVATHNVYDSQALATLRHAHKPLVQNLGLKTLATLELVLKDAMDRNQIVEAREAAAALAAVARHTARSLRTQAVQ